MSATRMFKMLLKRSGFCGDEVRERDSVAQRRKACHGRVLLGGDGYSDSRARVSPASGWAGSSTRLPIAATALTPAATRQAALKPWKNALEAAAWTAFA